MRLVSLPPYYIPSLLPARTPTPAIPFLSWAYFTVLWIPRVAGSKTTPPSSTFDFLYSLPTTHSPTRLTKLGASFNVKCLSDTQKEQ